MHASPMTLVRIAICLNIFLHGVARVSNGGVVPFGGFLESQGFPFGVAIATGITAYEILAPLIIASGRWIAPLCLISAIEYAVGIALVHWQHGWFVVGAGRNGMEYSVLLIACLLALAWQDWSRRRKAH
jgi:putative oxidoreductase